MFKLFSGKISGVLTLGLQGLTKAVGHILDAVVHTADALIDTLGVVLSPLTSALSHVPVLGTTVNKVLDTTTNLLDSVTGELHQTAHTLKTGNLEGGVIDLLDGVTSIAGNAVTGVAGLADHVVGLTDPLTEVLGQVPVLDGAVSAVGGTVDNLLGFVGETGQYVADINPTDLLNDLASNPTGTLGGVVQDLAGSGANLVADLNPLVDLASQIPVLGSVVGAVSETGTNLTGLLGETGQYIGGIDAGQFVGSLLTNPIATAGELVQQVSGTVDSLLDDIAPITDLTNPVPVVNVAVDAVGALAGGITAGLYDAGTVLSTAPSLLDQFQLPSFV